MIRRVLRNLAILQQLLKDLHSCTWNAFIGPNSTAVILSFAFCRFKQRKCIQLPILKAFARLNLNLIELFLHSKLLIATGRVLIGLDGQISQ